MLYTLKSVLLFGLMATTSLATPTPNTGDLVARAKAPATVKCGTVEFTKAEIDLAISLSPRGQRQLSQIFLQQGYRWQGCLLQHWCQKEQLLRVSCHQRNYWFRWYIPLILVKEQKCANILCTRQDKGWRQVPRCYERGLRLRWHDHPRWSRQWYHQMLSNILKTLALRPGSLDLLVRFHR